MQHIVNIPEDFVAGQHDFSGLIAALQEAFSLEDTLVPQRHHHDFPNPATGADTTLLLMPAWRPGREGGVKLVTVSPENGRFHLPSIQAMYVLFDADTGTVKASFQAKALTAKRTAAASALASHFLSRANSRSLLMIGTGALSQELIRAHSQVRPIQKVYVWGRNPDRARLVCDLFVDDPLEVVPVASIAESIGEVDIVSCATLSPTPLVLGAGLSPGQHIDLVGSYRKDTREADDATMARASVYVDTLQGGLRESGDIVIPLKNGTLTQSDIQGDLFGLCAGRVKGRDRDTGITVFKSVGHALEDLTAASYYYRLYSHESGI